jgi:hypothetical protein
MWAGNQKVQNVVLVVQNIVLVATRAAAARRSAARSDNLTDMVKKWGRQYNLFSPI